MVAEILEMIANAAPAANAAAVVTDILGMTVNAAPAANVAPAADAKPIVDAAVDAAVDAVMNAVINGAIDTAVVVGVATAPEKAVLAGTGSAAGLQRLSGAKRDGAVLLSPSYRKALRHVSRANRKSNSINIHRMDFENLQTEGAVKGCEAELLALVRTLLKTPEQQAYPDTSKKAIALLETRYGICVAGVARVENKELDEHHAEIRKKLGVGEKYRMVYHGTRIGAVESIQEHGFAFGPRQVWGVGIYTAPEWFDALFYAQCDQQGYQYFYMCEFYEGDIKVHGDRNSQGFGYGLDDKRVYTAQDPDGKMYIASYSAQVVPRYIIRVMDSHAYHDKTVPTAHSLKLRPYNQFVWDLIRARYWELMLKLAKPAHMQHAMASARKAADWWNAALDLDGRRLLAKGQNALAGCGLPITLPAALLAVPADPAALLAFSQQSAAVLAPAAALPASQLAAVAAPAVQPTADMLRMKQARVDNAAKSKAHATASFALAAAAVASLDAEGMANDQAETHIKMRVATRDAAASHMSATLNTAQGASLAVAAALAHMKIVKALARQLGGVSPPKLCRGHRHVCLGDTVQLYKMNTSHSAYVGQKGVVARIVQYGEGTKYLYEVELSGDADFKSLLKAANLAHSVANKEPVAGDPHHVVVEHSQITAPVVYLPVSAPVATWVGGSA